MSAFAPVIIIILAMLIQGSLQLTPGVFSIFYHSALGKLSSKKTDDLSLYFILGVEVYLAAILLAVFFIVSFCLSQFSLSPAVFWVLSGIAFAEAGATLFCYFRRSKATALFIPRLAAASLSSRARKARTRRQAFTLGFLSSIPELVFTLPLFVTMIFAMFLIPNLANSLILTLYIIIIIAPLFTVRTFFRADHNLGSITRLRTRLKPLIRFILCLSFLGIALILIYLGVIYG